MIDAYPLTWPADRPRSRWRDYARFKTTIGRAIENVQQEVQRLGGTNLIISSNLPLRRDGLPYARPGNITDTGVAVYFRYAGRDMCFACDCWIGIENNIQSIAKTIEALRGIERWGASDMMERAFTGFAQLPQSEPWWLILKFDSPPTTAEQLKERFRELAKTVHPDVGGSHEEFCRMQQAVETGIEVLEQNR